MPEFLQAVLDQRRGDPPSPLIGAAGEAAPEVVIAIHDDLAGIEQAWRVFERSADCTVFQTFDWLAGWYRHVGQRESVTPAIVTARGAAGELLFLIPLAVVPGIVRRLTFLGCELCDYNAPLLAADFSNRISAARFRVLWDEIATRLQTSPRHRHDVVELTKMPEAVGAQPNPFLALDVGLNASGAHVAELRGTWDEFYSAKRSSTTRRRDRKKRSHMAELGEVRFVTPQDPDELGRTLETLFVQKAKHFARLGIADIFARPGCRDFFFDLARNPATRQLLHISRLDVGSIAAATNLGLVFGGSYYHVVASYDDGEVSRFGPGAAHLRDLLQHAFASGCRLFDFTIGDERYKLEWSDRTIRLYDLIAPASARGWPIAALMLARRRLKRAIKQDPRLWNAFTRLRAALGTRSGSSGEEGTGGESGGKASAAGRD